MLDASPKPMIIPAANVSKDNVRPVSSVKSAKKTSDVLANKPNNLPDKAEKATPDQSKERGSASEGSTVQANNQTSQATSSNKTNAEEENKGQSFSKVMSQVVKEKSVEVAENSILPEVPIAAPVELTGHVLGALEKFIQANNSTSLNDGVQQLSTELSEFDPSLSDPEPEQASLVASMLSHVPKEIDPSNAQTDGVDLSNAIDNKAERSIDPLLANQEKLQARAQQNTQNPNMVSLVSKEGEKPVVNPLAAALSNLSPDQKHAKNDLALEAQLDETEIKLDAKSATTSLSLKEGQAMHADAFLKQLQAQIQPKQQFTGNNTPQPQMLFNTEQISSAAHSATQNVVTDPASVKSLQIETPVGQGQWSKQFNDQVVWLSSQKIQAAAIKLTPRELGPVEINLKISNDIASIQFHSHSPQVRELIEQALPKLRDQLAEQGIQLSDADVNDNSQQQQMMARDDHAGGENHFAHNDFFKELHGERADEQVMISEVRQKPPQGLVDYFA